MTAETATGVTETLRLSSAIAVSGDFTNGGGAAAKKSRERERRRRRRKQKKSNKATAAASKESKDGGDESDDTDDSSPNANKNQINEQVEIEFTPEVLGFEDHLLEHFKKVFEKFSFTDAAGVGEGNEKQDDTVSDAAANKKADSDSEEEEQDAQQKEKGVSNKKKKLQRRMKIAELKQICSRPDVVEVWDATAGDPKLLVFLKSYRNTVPVPRHWCQKRKFLQGPAVNIMEPGHVIVFAIGGSWMFSLSMYC